MSASVRQYTDKQLLDKVSSLKSFKGFPKNYWLIGIRSNADKFNIFDDKFFLFKGETFIEVYLGTTNAGNDLLDPTNSRGEAILKSNEIYYDCWSRGRHRGKVEAYVQTSPLPIYRDNDRDKKIEELGSFKLELVGINIHPATYNSGSTEIKSLINGWSQGCQVFAKRNGTNSFNSFMRKTEGQSKLTYCLLQEFDPIKISTPIKKLVDTNQLLSDKEIESVIESINELPNNSLNSTSSKVEDIKDDIIKIDKEKPSNITVGSSLSLQTSGISSLFISIYNALTNPTNITIIIISLVVGILLIGMGIYIYRKSSKEKLELNIKKLDLLSDKSKSNTDFNK